MISVFPIITSVIMWRPTGKQQAFNDDGRYCFKLWKKKKKHIRHPPSQKKIKLKSIQLRLETIALILFTCFSQQGETIICVRWNVSFCSWLDEIWLTLGEWRPQRVQTSSLHCKKKVQSCHFCIYMNKRFYFPRNLTLQNPLCLDLRFIQWTWNGTYCGLDFCLS